MEKDHVMAEMQRQIVELTEENQCLKACVEGLQKENKYYANQYNDLKNNAVKVDAAYLELCKKCNMYQNTVDSLAIRLADTLRGNATWQNQPENIE